MEVLAIIPSFNRLSSSRCDDWVDRINHVYTVMLLLVFAAVLSAAQYVGGPIYCWIPAELDENYFTNYINNYCWIKNTYYIPMFDVIPRNIQEREEEEITYYQWVPIYLLLQAFLFKLPNILWKMLHEGSGLNVDKLCKNAQMSQYSSPEDRKNAYEGLILIINKWIRVSQPYHNTRFSRFKDTLARMLCLVCYKRRGNFLTGLYLTVKLLYLVNVVAQFFFLNDFTANDSGRMYGLEWMQSFKTINGDEESPRFPRVTLCDFDIRQMANIQRYTVQCVLPINLFNEKVYLFLWFWFAIAAFLTFYNLLKWIYLIVVKRNNYAYVKKYLKIGGKPLQPSDKIICKRFAEDCLRDDGCFAARMISINSSDTIVTDMISHMFVEFRKSKYPNAAANSKEPVESVYANQSNAAPNQNHINHNQRKSGANGDPTDDVTNRRKRLRHQNSIR